MIILSVFAGMIAFTGCKPDPSLVAAGPDSSALISFQVPQGWPQPIYNFSENPLTQKGFELGRKLFYDKRLSKDNSISCAGCHAQFAAFAHLDHALSHGIYGLFGTRNAPGVYNMAWKPAFFWDGNEPSLEQQPRHPIENPVEMDMTVDEVLSRLNGDAEYRGLFRDAFQSTAITRDLLNKAFAQFMGAMVSANSRYDLYTRGESGGTLTEQELRGLSAFRDKCASCHKEPLFTDYSYRNNGLAVTALKDSGRAHVTRDPADLYRFMVPSLRNINLTRPFMHDGRFTTLDAVLEHYRNGIVASPTLDTLLTTGIAMTDAEKADIIAFLLTLSDNKFVADKRFSEPK